MDLKVNEFYFIVFFKFLLILKKSFYRVSYFDLNWTKYSMLQEFDIDFDLTAVFSLNKSPTCSPE